MNQSPNLKEIAKILRSHPFAPSAFFNNVHIQTLFSHTIPYFRTTIPKKERELIPLSDGSRLVVDCWFQKKKEKCATVVLISGFEGYNGSGRSFFVRSMLEKVYASGYNVIHIKQRGEAESVHFTKSLFAADPTHDMVAAFQHLSDLGLKKLYLVGFSWGGWVALFTLANLEKKMSNNVKGAVAISPGGRLFDTWAQLEKNPFYNWSFLQFYKNLVKRRMKIDPPGMWNAAKLKKTKTRREFAESFFPHSFGYQEKFSTIDEYHRKTDVTTFLPSLNIPSLIIHAQDDPINPVTPFTQPAIQENPSIITLLPQYGGHGGFFTFKKIYGDLDRHWAQNRAIEFIRLLDKR